MLCLGSSSQSDDLVNAPGEKVRLIVEFILLFFCPSGTSFVLLVIQCLKTDVSYILPSFLFVSCGQGLVQYLLHHYSSKQKSTQDKFSLAFLTESVSKFYLLQFRAVKQLPLLSPQELIVDLLFPLIPAC